MKSKELKRRAAEKLAEAEKVTKAIEAENRDMTDEERQQFDSILAEAERLKADGDRAERAERLHEWAGTPEPRVVPPEKTTGESEQRIVVPHYPESRLLRVWGENRQERLENAYRSGRFILAVVAGHESSRQWCVEHGMRFRSPEERAMGAADVTKGAVLVPEEFENAVIALMDTYGNARQECQRVPMARETKNVPRRTSGLTAYALGENTAGTASDKTWDKVELVARKWGVLTQHASELDEDSVIDIAQDLAQEGALAFATKEDQCCIDGTGASTYHGIVGIRTKMVDGSHAGSYNDATAGDDQWGEYILGDFNDLMGKLRDYAYKRGNVKWHVSRICWHATFQRLQAAAGGNAWGDIARGAMGAGPTFLGYPVVLWNAMPTATTALDAVVVVLFGDMQSAVMFGDRRGMTIKRSEERYLEYDQIGILMTERMDIVVHDIGDSSSAGPLVGLRGNTS